MDSGEQVIDYFNYFFLFAVSVEWNAQYADCYVF